MAKAKEEQEKLLPTTRIEDIERYKNETQTHHTHQTRRVAKKTETKNQQNMHKCIGFK